MSTTVVHYSASNPAIIPLKQYVDNGATNIYRGMPQKTGYADGTASFAKGRGVFTRASTSTGFLIDPKAPHYRCGSSSVVRVDSHALKRNGSTDPYVNNPDVMIKVGGPRSEAPNRFSFSALPTGWSIHRRGPTRSYQPLVNGKQNEIMSSAELISRRKNNAIGRGSIPPSDNAALSFNANNLYGSHTNLLETSNARRRCRNSGYVVPPKCRIGPVSGPYIHGTALNQAGALETGNCGRKGGTGPRF